MQPAIGTRRRLLFLAPFPPRLDAFHGGSRSIAQLLAKLAHRHRIALLYLRAPVDPPLDPVLQERCEVVEEVMRPNPGAWFSGATARMRSLLQGMPVWAAGCSVAECGARVRSLASRWKPHVVQIEYHVMAQYLSALADCPAPRVLIEHEPGTGAAREAWQSGRGISRAIRYVDWLAWRRFEQSIAGQVQAVVVFTARDRETLAPIAGHTPIIRIPLATTLPERPLDPRGGEPPSMLFVGNFMHPPNVDAAVRLVGAIFPQVQARIPGALLRIVGDKPPARLAESTNPGVVVTGGVPDVTPYLDKAAVVVIPVRMGGGMRVKVLEALAAGKAVVASRLAAEGLDVVQGRQIHFAESDREFADASFELLLDVEKRASLAAGARAWALENLGWERAVGAYESLYDSLDVPGL